MSGVAIRRTERSDIPALLAIYNHYILNTAFTFDVEPRTLAQRESWFAQFSDSGRYRCFTAAREGDAIGWACSTVFNERAAYETSVLTSIYLAPGHTGRGIGRRLYDALFAALADADVHRAYSGITQPNEASVALHLAMGFRHTGTYREVGRKFGRYWDVAWYEKAL